MVPVKNVCRAMRQHRVICSKLGLHGHGLSTFNNNNKKEDQQRLGPHYSPAQPMKILDRVRM